MQNTYKITVIFETREQKESAEEMLQRLGTLMQGLGGTVESAKNLGVHDFARCTDRHFRSAPYAQYVVHAAGDFNGKLGSRLKLDKTVNRVLIEKA